MKHISSRQPVASGRPERSGRWEKNPNAVSDCIIAIMIATLAIVVSVVAILRLFHG